MTWTPPHLKTEAPSQVRRGARLVYHSKLEEVQNGARRVITTDGLTPPEPRDRRSGGGLKRVSVPPRHLGGVGSGVSGLVTGLGCGAAGSDAGLRPTATCPLG